MPSRTLNDEPFARRRELTIEKIPTAEWRTTSSREDERFGVEGLGICDSFRKARNHLPL